jgi:hypothetical protein
MDVRITLSESGADRLHNELLANLFGKSGALFTVPLRLVSIPYVAFPGRLPPLEACCGREVTLSGGMRKKAPSTIDPQRARSLSPFLLVKTSPIGSELNDIGGASNAPVEVNKNNLGAET